MNDINQFKSDFSVNAAWEARDGRTICRWMLVWLNLSQSEIAGCAAGYSGGGTFQLEKFYIRHNGDEISFLQIDNEDRINSVFADFSSVVPRSAVEVSENCQDLVLSWHDTEKWEDAENLYLLDAKSEGLSEVDKMFLLGNADAGFLVRVLECIGITAKPST